MLELLGLIIVIIGAVLWIPYIMKTSKDGAPYVPMEPEIVEEVMKLAEIKEGDVFYELGSGDGRLVIAAALRGAKSYGIEIDTLRALYSRLWLKVLRLRNAQIIKDNFFNVDLSEATVISTYLLTQTNEKLKEKFLKELKKGTRVVTTGFLIPGWEPVKINPKGPIYGPIYLYIV